MRRPGRGPWFREHADRPDESDRGCWWFSSHPSDEPPQGRFDLTEPDGTCYVGETAGVAVRERVGRFLAARLPVPSSHLDGRVVSEVELPRVYTPAADCLSPDAATFGVTAELSTVDDYALTAAWAEALHDAGHLALLYQARFTPGGEHALALFGPAGRVEATVVASTPTTAHLRRLGVTVAATPSSKGSASPDDGVEPD